MMNLRQVRKLGNRLCKGSRRPLPASQTSYTPAQLMAAAMRLYRSWHRACPRRPDGSRSTGLDFPHGDFFAGNRIASLHDRGYYLRHVKPPHSAYVTR